MKKPAKKPTPRISPKKVMIASALIIMGLIAGSFISFHVIYYVKATNQASIEPIRELILSASQASRKPAPVDPQTGNIYFPESRLFVPNPHNVRSLTYIQDTYDITDSQGELSVSTTPVRGNEKLYTAKDTEELFAAVPKLQACSRGVKLVTKPYPASDTTNVLQHTVTTNDGRTIYIYIEKDCPENNETANILKNVQSY